MTCGVYQIYNKVSGERYVGSSVRVKSRLRDHRRGLRAGTHDNQKLQWAWDEYGEVAFIFEVLVRPPKALLHQYEQDYIDIWDTVRSGYNINPTAGSGSSEAGRASVRARVARGLDAFGQTPEEHVESSRKGGQKRTGPHSKEWNCSISEGQKRRHAARRLTSSTKLPAISVGLRRYHAALTFEQRSEKAKRGWATRRVQRRQN